MRTRGIGIIAFLALALGLALGLARSVPASVSVGDKVEDIALEKRGGGTVRLPADLQGRVILVNFWASWCPECKTEMPELNRLAREFQGKAVVLLAVNVDRKRKAADDFLTKHPTDLTVLYDTDQNLVRAFSPVGIPASYLIGPDGRVAKRYLGFSEGSINAYRSDIEALIRDIPAQVPSGQDPSEDR